MVASPRLFYKPQLDALRAVAVSAVLVHHFLPVAKFIPEDFLTLGLLAVRLFFVLSGYLITGILLRSRKLGFRTALKQFYIRRALRILPIYYLTIIVLALIGFPSIRQYFLWHVVYLSNILFVLEWAPVTSESHLWTLSVEEQFYFVWPFLMLLVPYKHILKVILGALAVGILWKTIIAFTLGGVPAGGILTPACLDSLSIGALFAFIEHDETLRAYRDRFLRSALIVGGIIVVIQLAIFLSGYALQLFWSTAYVGVSLIFVWLVGRATEGFGGKIRTLMEWRPVLYVGKISYGVYLYHNFMPSLVRYIAGALGLNPPGVLMMFVWSAALTFLVASVSWHLIERPLNRLKDTFSYEKRKPIIVGEPAGGFDS